MSEQENTNICRKTYEFFMRGDIESLLKHYTDDVQWEVYGPASLPTTGAREGLPEVRQFFSQVNELMEAESFEPKEFIAQGDQVAVLGHYIWTVKATGRRFIANWAHIVTFENGKITRFREYTDTAAAVEAFAKGGMAQQARP